jgi:hypothetical protein
MEQNNKAKCEGCKLSLLIQKIQNDYLKLRSLTELESKQRFKFIRARQGVLDKIFPN